MRRVVLTIAVLSLCAPAQALAAKSHHRARPHHKAKHTTATRPSAAKIANPISVKAPTVTANGSVLTCNPGTWSGGKVTFTYDWVVDELAFIPGANDQTYNVPLILLGHKFSCVVTGANSMGTDQGQSADLLAPILPL
jgi:hypothetical protein